jgi:hypothetical protein
LAIPAVAVWCSIMGPRFAMAQQTSSFEQLRVLVEPGDTVVVIDADGKATQGKIESLSAASLRLASKGSVREFGQRDAVEIRQRRGDSLKNGAIIGAVTGGGLGTLGAVALCSHGWCRGNGAEVAAAIVFCTGVGAAAGVGIDALFKPTQTIYRAPGQTAFNAVRVVPLLGGGRKGVAVRWSF